jgi:hypothetical protein
MTSPYDPAPCSVKVELAPTGSDLDFPHEITVSEITRKINNKFFIKTPLCFLSTKIELALKCLLLFSWQQVI